MNRSERDHARPAAPGRPSTARRVRRAGAAAAFAVLLAPAATLAESPTGGTSPAGSPATPTSVAAAASGRPMVAAVTCRTACMGLATARRGSVVRVTGEGVGAAALVIFLGRRGRRDDVVVSARSVSPTAIEVVLPRRARSGPVAVRGPSGRSRRSRRILDVGRAPERHTGRATVEARVETRRVYVDETRRAALDVFVRAGGAADLVVDVVRQADGVAVAQWTPAPAPAGTVQTIEWDGTLAGEPQPEGHYAFRVSRADGATRAAQVAPGGLAAAVPAAGDRSFLLLRNRFPIAGEHRYGEDGGRFGARRDGHSHQGQDVFADCGTPLVAAQGGTVKFAGSQRRAGNYVVITATASGQDYVYMHLRDDALVHKGDAVATGQAIGSVGDTGVAHGCHLHFELWDAPGWYTGGSPVDPLPSLQAWDPAQG